MSPTTEMYEKLSPDFKIITGIPEILWVQFQATAIKQILQLSKSQFFWFPSASKCYVYTIL